MIPKYLVAIVCLVFVILLGGMGWFAFNFGKMQAQRDQLAMQLQTQGICKFNDHIANDPRAEVVILPLRDGLTLIRKKY